MTQCGTCVPRLYKSVIEEVISGVRDSFLDEGIDDQVLSDLKQQWEAKLAVTKAAEHSEMTQQHQQNQQQQNAASQQQVIQQAAAPVQPAQVSGLAVVPIQITVPSQPAGGIPKIITIHTPSSALSSGIAGPQLQSILSSPAAAQTFALDASQAAEIIQRQLNAALQQNGVALPAQLLQYNQPIMANQVDGLADVFPGPSISGYTAPPALEVTAPALALDQVLERGLSKAQVDGATGLGDSSDEISDDDDDDDDEEEGKDEDGRKGDEEDDDEDEDGGDGDEGCAEEPLNSDDDVTGDEASDIFDTENVVVCQYDKITRVRNKWKFHLKDGIMNLKTKDYVFTKASGEGEW